MTEPAASVVCAGRVYCDLIFTGLPHLPVMGEETFAKDLSLHAGGGAFITAAAFAALGWRASVLATVPAAPFDTLVRADMAQAGVDDRLCRAGPKGMAPQITVAAALDGDRAFLTHKAGAAVPDVTFDQGQFRHLHIGELRSLMEQPDLITQARNAGMTVSLDCGWDAELMGQGAQMAELVAQVDVFLPNASEFAALTASGLPGDLPPVTVVKMGAEGAKATHNNGWCHVPVDPTDVIDTTGAGDAFNGGFLAGWLSGDPIEACLHAGNFCGAASVRHVGGTGGLANLRADMIAAQAGAAQ